MQIILNQLFILLVKRYVNYTKFKSTIFIEIKLSD